MAFRGWKVIGLGIMCYPFGFWPIIFLVLTPLTWNEWVKNIKNNISSKIFFITFSFHPIWIIVNLDWKYFYSCYDIVYGMMCLDMRYTEYIFLNFPPSKWTFFSYVEAVSCFYAFIPHSISSHTFDRNRINRFDDTRLIQKWTGEEN